MIELMLKEVQKAVNGELLQGDPLKKIKGVSIDSRMIQNGELFIAIPGERFDGHDFVKEAIKKGASGVVVNQRVDCPPDTALILVKDTTQALQKLAQYYRLKFGDLKVIAITGSAGKTSTKDITASVLKEGFRVSKTEGNLNNFFGLPLTILRLEGNEDVAVLELGMSQLGEIKLLTEIAQPDIGVLTNVGATHLEFLGTVENVARGKSELIQGLPADGTAVLNADNPYVLKMNRVFDGQKIVFYGIDNDRKAILDSLPDDREYSIEFVMGEIIGTGKDGTTRFKVYASGEEVELVLYKPGKHNVYNALAAIAVARELGLDWQEIQRGLKNVEFSALRWDVRTLKEGITVINDAYNANPLSMRAALKAAQDSASGRVIAVLGAMFELGDEEEQAHLELGAFVHREGVDVLLTVGKTGELIARGALESGMERSSVLSFADNDRAGQKLLQLLRSGDTVLVKGSRGNKMEEIVEMLTGLEE